MTTDSGAPKRRTRTAELKARSPRLLALLEGEFCPKAGGSQATLRAAQPPADITASVVLPAWNWIVPGLTEEERADTLTLDVNGAYLAAASSTVVAHGPLVRTGPLPAAQYRKLPGYYRVPIPMGAWNDWRIPHPLGDSRHDGHTAWLAEPTLTLLCERAAKDEWAPPQILDSWTAESGMKVRLSDWTGEVNRRRLELMDSSAPAAELDAFKVGYAQAIQMIGGSVDENGKSQCLIRRPDWQRQIWAQHAANTWRKVRNAVDAGARVLALRHKDAVTITPDTLYQIYAMPRPPIRLDQTGRQLGAMKIDHEGPMEL